MTSEIRKIGGSKIDLEVALDQKEFQKYWQSAYDEALSTVQVKGFRPGTAPKEIADKAVDKEKIFEEAAREAVRRSLDSITKEKEWIIIDQPRVELKDSSSGGFKYKATITIFPEVKLPDYKKIARKVFSEKKEVEPATDQEVENAIEYLRGSRAKIVRVNREAKKGDVVEIDLESSIDGEVVDNFKNDKFILGRSYFVPGFDEKLEGKKAGEEVEFSLIAPNDFRQEKLRGKKVDFKVKLNAVFDRQLPNLDDAFARTLGKFENIADLQNKIRLNLTQEKQQKERNRLRAKVLDEIIKKTEMEIPDIMIEKTLDQITFQFKQMIKDEKKYQEFRDKMRGQAEHNVAANLVLYKIAQDAKIGYDEKGELDNEKIFQYLENL